MTTAEYPEFREVRLDLEGSLLAQCESLIEVIGRAGPKPHSPLQLELLREAWHISTATIERISNLPELDEHNLHALELLQELADEVRELIA
jgi:hypothetical protein